MPLESIFEFILSNIFFVMLIIGGLLSFFNRAKKGEEQRHEGQPEKVDWREIFKQEASEQQPQPRQPTQSQTEPEIVSFEPVISNHEASESVKRQELYERLEEMRKRREVKRELKPSQQSISSNEIRRSDGLELNLHRLSNKEAMKAVVWAEVLGKPRGRHPHQTFSQRSRSR